MKYEYLTASFDPRIKFQDWLNQMGQAGWRFHSVIETRTTTTPNPQPLIVAGLFVFEREARVESTTDSQWEAAGIPDRPDRM